MWIIKIMMIFKMIIQNFINKQDDDDDDWLV